MFSICKQTHPATGVEHAISCNFLNKIEKCLVTAGANILKVFKLVPDSESRLRGEKFSGIVRQIVFSRVIFNSKLSFIYIEFFRFTSSKIKTRMYSSIYTTWKHYVDSECFIGQLSKRCPTVGFF